ncbi:unnamed protein product [Moneuplotes crassus]|uniref:Uncharacterized protein n=1 Tax=Euplotes crassus TaxID=5936 RepID=A0AAD1UE27_EUPCR|nr:unnamed protein product [Moneuplotes crassus]
MDTIAEVTESPSKIKSSLQLLNITNKNMTSYKKKAEENMFNSQHEKENIGVVNSERKFKIALHPTEENSALSNKPHDENPPQNVEFEFFLTPEKEDDDHEHEGIKENEAITLEKQKTFQTPAFSSIENQTGGNSSSCKKPQEQEEFEMAQTRKNPALYQESFMQKTQDQRDLNINSRISLCPEKSKTVKKVRRRSSSKKSNSKKKTKKTPVILQLNINPKKINKLIRKDLLVYNKSNLRNSKVKVKKLRARSSLKQLRPDSKISNNLRMKKSPERQSSSQKRGRQTPKIMKKTSQMFQKADEWLSDTNYLTSFPKEDKGSLKKKRGSKSNLKTKIIKNCLKEEKGINAKQQAPKDLGLDEFLQRSIPVGKLLNYMLCNVNFDPNEVNFLQDLAKMAEG